MRKLLLFIFEEDENKIFPLLQIKACVDGNDVGKIFKLKRNSHLKIMMGRGEDDEHTYYRYI